MEILSRLNPAMITRPLKDGYVEPSFSGTTFTPLNLSWMLLIMAINYRFSKFLRPSQLKNNSSALEQAAFVESAINDLFINGCVTEVFEAPVIINLLSVSVQKSGKKRLILDLRHVNQFLYKCRFRCEDLSIAKEVLNPGDFMFTFDLKSGYHYVEIFPEHRKYLSFAWIFSSGRTSFFQFFPVFCSSVWPQFRALFIY